MPALSFYSAGGNEEGGPVSLKTVPHSTKYEGWERLEREEQPRTQLAHLFGLVIYRNCGMIE